MGDNNDAPELAIDDGRTSLKRGYLGSLLDLTELKKGKNKHTLNGHNNFPKLKGKRVCTENFYTAVTSL